MIKRRIAGRFAGRALNAPCIPQVLSRTQGGNNSWGINLLWHPGATHRPAFRLTAERQAYFLACARLVLLL